MGSQQMRILQELNAFGGDSQWAAQHKRANRVGSNDNRNQRQKWVVDERSTVDCDLVEAKKKCRQRSHDRVKTEEGGKSNENSD